MPFQVRIAVPRGGGNSYGTSRSGVLGSFKDGEDIDMTGEATLEDLDQNRTLNITTNDNLGKTGAELTYWLIEESLKSGGEVLDRQEKSFDAKRAQATSMLGWFVSITTAVTFATVSANKIAVGACIAALSTIPCCCCVYALMSKAWSYKQLHPQQTLEANESSERDYKLANSLGLQMAINDNAKILQKIDLALNSAWLTFCIVPISGLLFYSIFS